MSPLHCAALGGDAGIVRALLDAGADPCLASVDGRLGLVMAGDKKSQIIPLISLSLIQAAFPIGDV